MESVIKPQQQQQRSLYGQLPESQVFNPQQQQQPQPWYQSPLYQRYQQQQRQQPPHMVPEYQPSYQQYFQKPFPTSPTPLNVPKPEFQDILVIIPEYEPAEKSKPFYQKFL